MIPVWAAVAAAAAPSVIGALLPRPSMPTPDYSAAMALANSPEMQRYRTAMLQNAFDPQANLYQLASQQALAQVNRAMAQRGLGSSSLALGQIGATQADLANQWLASAAQRQQMAFNAAQGQLNNAAGIASNQSQALYQRDMMNYQNSLQNQANMVQGISGMINAGMSAYNYNQTTAAQAAQNQAMQDRWDYLTGYPGAPTGATSRTREF